MTQYVPSNGHHHASADVPPVNPFATTRQNQIIEPTYPKPIAQVPQRIIAPLEQSPDGRQSSRQDSADSAHKSTSLSTTTDSLLITPMSSADREKRSLARESNSHRSSKHKRSSRDPEKSAGYSPNRHSRERHSRSSHTHISYTEDDDVDEARELQEEKAVKILLFFSFPCVVLSLLNAIWTLLSLLITLLTQPVRVCARRPTFGQQLGGLLGPALNLQLKSIYTPLPPHADEDLSYHPAMLVAVQLLSPFLSFGMMLAAWVMAVYWLSSAVVGDPAGTDKRDDGKETVLALRGWWEKWLTRSVRED